MMATRLACPPYPGWRRGACHPARMTAPRVPQARPVARVSGGNVPLPVAASLEAEVDVSPARVVAASRAVLSHGRQASGAGQREG